MPSAKLKGVVAITCSAFGFALMALFVRLCDDYGAPVSSFQKIAVFDYSNILFTAAFGYLFFAQVPDVWSVLGFVAILLAARLTARHG